MLFLATIGTLYGRFQNLLWIQSKWTWTMLHLLRIWMNNHFHNICRCQVLRRFKRIKPLIDIFIIAFGSWFRLVSRIVRFAYFTLAMCVNMSIAWTRNIYFFIYNFLVFLTSKISLKLLIIDDKNRLPALCSWLIWIWNIFLDFWSFFSLFFYPIFLTLYILVPLVSIIIHQKGWFVHSRCFCLQIQNQNVIL